jgi:hypothetical protein
VAQVVQQCVQLAQRGGEVGNGDADVLAGVVFIWRRSCPSGSTRADLYQPSGLREKD